MTVWRLFSLAVLVLGLWLLVWGLRSAPGTAPVVPVVPVVPVAPVADAASVDSQVAAPAEAGWSTQADGSFSAQPPLSLGFSPLEQPTPAAASDWERRLSDARSEQLRLEAMTELTPAQRDAALQAHLQRHFSAAERARVAAGLRLMPR